MSPWRQRNFQLVWVGGLVNNLGDWLLLVALPVYVFTETGSGTTTAVLFTVEVAVAVVLGPVGGAVVDRHDLRRLLIATNLAQAAALLPLLAVTSERIWPAYLVAAAQAALTTVNNPAAAALLPRLVAPDQLAVANAANSTSASLARLVGSPLGGVIVGVGGLGPVVLVDGISFLAVAAATWFVRADTAPAGSHEHAGVRAGLRFVRHERRLRRLLEAMTVAQLAQGFFVVLFVVFVVDELDAGGTGVGLIRGMMAVGAIVGAAIVARFGKRTDPLRLLVIGYAGMGLVAFVFWNATVVTTALWVYVVLFTASGLPGAALTVGSLTALQQSSPPEYLGRVLGAFLVSDALGVGVGSIVAGLLVDRVDLHLLLDVQAGIYVLAAVLVAAVARLPKRPIPAPGVGARMEPWGSPSAPAPSGASSAPSDGPLPSSPSCGGSSWSSAAASHPRSASSRAG